MLNEDQIRNNITCAKEGGFEVYQALWILAGANGGTLTQDDIEYEWARAEEEWEHTQKLWAMENKNN